MKAPTAGTAAQLELAVESDPVAPEWDRFLEQVPSGHHTQTAMWASVKETVGWQAARVLGRRDGTIVAGAQILYRRVPVLGHAGYVANGPVAEPGRDDDAERVLDEVERVARRLRIRHLVIQPPVGGVTPAEPGARGYLDSSSQVAPGATVVVDLGQDDDELLAGMRRKTRYNVRISARKGVTVRSGDQADVGPYHEMVRATGARQGFEPFPLEYFDQMWRALHPGGHLRLAVAELDGEPVAAQMAVAFGDTVVNKLSVWSGRAGSCRPNEALQWATMQWANGAGYARYDMEGIDVEAARLLLAGRPLPASFDQTVTSFKLGFGGRVVTAPRPHEHLYNPAARWLFAEVYPRLRRRRATRRAMKRFVKRLRTGAT